LQINEFLTELLIICERITHQLNYVMQWWKSFYLATIILHISIINRFKLIIIALK